MIDTLIPLPGYALIEVRSEYKSGLSVEKEKYSTNTSGCIVAVNFHEDDKPSVRQLAKHIGDIAYFDGFKDGESIKDRTGEYVFVPVSEIRGVRKYA